MNKHAFVWKWIDRTIIILMIAGAVSIIIGTVFLDDEESWENARAAYPRP